MWHNTISRCITWWFHICTYWEMITVISHWKVKVKSLSRVRLLETPWTVAHQAPPSMEFSRQEYCSGLPFPYYYTVAVFFLWWGISRSILLATFKYSISSYPQDFFYNWKLVLLTTFRHFIHTTLPPIPASGNHQASVCIFELIWGFF